MYHCSATSAINKEPKEVISKTRQPIYSVKTTSLKDADPARLLSSSNSIGGSPI
jgi:hypothetical protein